MASVSAFGNNMAVITGCGEVNWTNSTDALVGDDSYANAATGPGNTTYCLRATDFGFGLNNSSDVVTGIMVIIRKYANSSVGGGYVADRSVKLIKVTAVGGNGDSPNDYAKGNVWSEQKGNVANDSYGGDGDLWGYASISPAEVNNTAFGAVMSAKIKGGIGSSEAWVDAMAITVYYGSKNATELYGIDHEGNNKYFDVEMTNEVIAHGHPIYLKDV